MDPKLPFNENKSGDSFKNPDHKLPDQFATNKGADNASPFHKSLVREMLLGPDITRKKEPKSNPNEKKSIFDKKGGGATWSEFGKAAEKLYDPLNIHLNQSERKAVAKEPPKELKKRLGQRVSPEDATAYIKYLEKEQNDSKEDYKRKQQIKLIEKLKKPK